MTVGEQVVDPPGPLLFLLFSPKKQFATIVLTTLLPNVTSKPDRRIVGRGQIDSRSARELRLPLVWHGI
jgi:hypothetical protein